MSRKNLKLIVINSADTTLQDLQPPSGKWWRIQDAFVSSNSDPWTLEFSWVTSTIKRLYASFTMGKNLISHLNHTSEITSVASGGVLLYNAPLNFPLDVTHDCFIRVDVTQAAGYANTYAVVEEFPDEPS